MRKFSYALAAAVALAPLAAIAPASAAVQHPAAAQTVCNGHEEADMKNTVSGGTLSWWYVSPSNSVNDAHANVEVCVEWLGFGGVR